MSGTWRHYLEKPEYHNHIETESQSYLQHDSTNICVTQCRMSISNITL